MDRQARSGFTLVEMLLALALGAMLLGSMGAAMKALLDGYQANDRIASVSQAARATLDHMMSDVRTASTVESTSSAMTITPAGQPTVQIQYQLDSDGKLYYRKTIAGGGTTSSVLLGGTGLVGVNTFAVAPLRLQDDLGQWYTSAVTVRLVLQCGNETLAMTASACPRRNQEY